MQLHSWCLDRCLPGQSLGNNVFLGGWEEHLWNKHLFSEDQAVFLVKTVFSLKLLFPANDDEPPECHLVHTGGQHSTLH